MSVSPDTDSYLPPGLPIPVPAPDGLDEPFWSGLADDKILIQRCDACERWQWGPEFVCHRCHSLDLSYAEVKGPGVVYSHERVWHPVHPALGEHGPYIVVLVEFPHADGVRFVGNLVGDPHQPLTIGAEVDPVFEHHADSDPPFTLLQWKIRE